MAGVLFSIPVSLWVHGTIEKMNRFKKRDIHSWGEYWLETYLELGGKSTASGSKGCPQHAAYGLWRLGRIKGTNMPLRNFSLSLINREFGKNTTYAILALELLENGQAAMNQSLFWAQVQELFRKRLHNEPANSQQGAVTIAQVLYDEGLIVVNPE